MRHVTYALTPERGYFDPGEVVFRECGVVLRSIQELDLLTDGTAVTLYEAEATRDQIDGSLAQADGKVIDYQVADAGGHVVLQVHYHPSDLIRNLIELHDSYATHLDYPLEFVDPSTSSLRVSVIGAKDQLQAQIAATREEVDVTVERIGDYDPGTDRRFAALTERQREVLLIAVRKGYYESPREATYDDIAADLDCSASAVGKHLRRIESELVDATVSDRAMGEFHDTLAEIQ
ncbi:helix-turn-helix domain-containing protein [Halorientalis pallida]|uniref:DNA-binding protein n=1 Tax=Halorientalis pallida TaxID=2479928 RepID=A0A498KQ77_9EURY|nr:helix-turn-helix domain-containing protein [Halorientalis pallida]RXK46326.1 DNA-binding protein [Halorientalis pallida]